MIMENKRAKLEMNMLGTETDRLSDLPEPIKLHILSFLPTKFAVRTSILSRDWQTLYVGLPCLKLGTGWNELGSSLTDERLPDNNNYIMRGERELILRLREGFYKFLDRVLGSNLKLEKLKLCVAGSESDLKSRLDGWLDGAVRRGVKELDIEVCTRGAHKYNLSSRVFAANWITKLNLKNFQLDHASLVEGLWPCLDELHLVDVHLDQLVMERILATCKILKKLSILYCEKFSKLEILGLPRLEKVDVEYLNGELESFKIEAPNLVNLRFSTRSECKLDIKGCEKMKYLELDRCDDLDDETLYDLMHNAPLLERLFISKCHNLGFADIYGENLVDLTLDNCGNLWKVRAYTPKLQYLGFHESDMITFVSKGPALRLKHAIIQLKYRATDEKWYAKLIKLLAKLNHCETLALEVPSEKDLILPESVRMSQRPPLSAVKHFNIEFAFSKLKHPVAVIESLLWLAPHPESISIDKSSCIVSTSKSLKFEYEKPVKGKKKCGCFKSLSNSCWRHSLDKVWIQNKGRVDDDAELIYFFNTSRIDGKIECFSENIKSKYYVNMIMDSSSDFSSESSS